MTHEAYIEGLLPAAQINDGRDIPIHACIVKSGETLSKAHNQKEGLQDPTAHAEVLVIREAAQKMGSWRLPDTTLYVLVEPCWMCTGAIYAARIPRVVFGVCNPKGGGLLHAQKHRRALGLNHSVEVDYGYHEDKIQTLLSHFFASKRG